MGGGDVSGSSSLGIFLSYRRGDAAPYARLLQRQLRERFPEARVFMDLDSIERGPDFHGDIREAVVSCVMLVVVIGRQWRTLADEGGHQRLGNQDDWVRFEVQAALESGMWVIPVLVDGAEPLREQQLPPELRTLARLHALELRSGRYECDADRLFDLIQRVLAAASGIACQPFPTANVAVSTTPQDVRSAGNILGDAAQQDPIAVRNDLGRAAQLIQDAEHLAQSITDECQRASALADIAAVLVATEPDRAAQLIEDAEHLAQSVTEKYSKDSVLTDIVVALAATDPDRAEHLLKSITMASSMARALAELAIALAATDPDRAERLARTISSVGDVFSEYPQACALAAVAKALAATEPYRAARLLVDAERLAESIGADFWKASALAAIANALTAIDPYRAARFFDRAERLAQSLRDKKTTDKSIKASVLADIARALAATEPRVASRLVQSITVESTRTSALADMLGTLGAFDKDLDRAERIARSITDKRWQVRALVRVAEARSLYLQHPGAGQHPPRSAPPSSSPPPTASTPGTAPASDPNLSGHGPGSPVTAPPWASS